MFGLVTALAIGPQVSRESILLRNEFRFQSSDDGALSFQSAESEKCPSRVVPWSGLVVVVNLHFSRSSRRTAATLECCVLALCVSAWKREGTYT